MLQGDTTSAAEPRGAAGSELAEPRQRGDEPAEVAEAGPRVGGDEPAQEAEAELSPEAYEEAVQLAERLKQEGNEAYSAGSLDFALVSLCDSHTALSCRARESSSSSHHLVLLFKSMVLQVHDVRSHGMTGPKGFAMTATPPAGSTSCHDTSSSLTAARRASTSRPCRRHRRAPSSSAPCTQPTRLQCR